MKIFIFLPSVCFYSFRLIFLNFLKYLRLFLRHLGLREVSIVGDRGRHADQAGGHHEGRPRVHQLSILLQSKGDF